MAESTLTILLDLLDRLPLPLMLQTERGELIAQNPLWQQQCQSLQPLAQPALGCDSASYGAESGESAANIQSFYPQSGVYQQTQIGIDEEKAQSVWTLSYIPLGTFAVNGRSPRDWTLQTESDVKAVSTVPDPSQQSTHLDVLWLVLAENHTQEEQITQELAARNADLIQLNRLKDEFLACVTHELKTPLTAILGLSSLLKDQMLGTLNDRQSRYIHMIHQSGRQLMKIVNDILDLTRLETGQIELTREPVNLRHVCDRAISATYQLYTQLNTGNQSAPSDGESTTNTSRSGSPSNPKTTVVPPDKVIALEIEAGLEWVVADESRLRQMLINLLSNAMKFTTPHDKIGLQVNRWQDWVAFSVWDTGIGIPEDKQVLLFQKFQQLEHPLTRQFEGMGLGLIITQLLARLHGGDVSFVSQEAEGSTFTILIPNSHWEEEDDDFSSSGSFAASLSQQVHSSTDPPILLIAHTNPSDLVNVQEHASTLNVRIMAAHSGLEALGKARRLKPAAIVINPLLPLLSGSDVLTLLKADPETAKIPVLFLAPRTERQAFVNRPIEGLLSLPLNPAELQTSLMRLFPIPSSFIPQPTQLLTVIRLVDRELFSGTGDRTQATDLLTAALDQIMQKQRCQVIEVDDLEQAELLAQIWKPQLLIVETLGLSRPQSVLNFIRQSEVLSKLTLISLVPVLSALAAHDANVTIYGYEGSPIDHEGINPAQLTDLVALLQTALSHVSIPRSSVVVSEL